MLDEQFSTQFAEDLIFPWNQQDLDKKLSQVLGNKTGTLQGKSNLKAHFDKGLQAYPQFNFELLDVLRIMHSIVLYKINPKGTKTAEYMEIGSTDKIVKVVANSS
ncbi:nuclear transport factor 2 family protein [Capilliphycus salinus ALCB114379]|uniref:nuclear transport factor 2 family protein n=1 Tax=Capilliphycus salinus TaxID=2768948 RepID=UPI0039A7563F